MMSTCTTIQFFYERPSPDGKKPEIEEGVTIHSDNNSDEFVKKAKEFAGHIEKEIFRAQRGVNFEIALTDTAIGRYGVGSVASYFLAWLGRKNINAFSVHLPGSVESTAKTSRDSDSQQLQFIIKGQRVLVTGDGSDDDDLNVVEEDDVNEPQENVN